MKTPLLTIQNGTVVSSRCKGLKNNFIKPSVIIILIVATTWINSSKNKCWSHCGQKGGKCSYCDVIGSEGFCCRRDNYNNGDCPDSAIASSDRRHHGCVYNSRSGFIIFFSCKKKLALIKKYIQKSFFTQEIFLIECTYMVKGMDE